MIEFDVQKAIYLAFMTVGCSLMFLCLVGAFISYKRIIPIHCMFAFILTCCTIILLVLGITLLVTATKITDEMDASCAANASSSGGISQSFNELYSSADSFYCVASNGCTCYSTTIVGAGYSSTNSSTTIVNVQGCTDYLEDAYADYGVSFKDVVALKEYLAYFGEIESQFSCSGICYLKTKYYFSDINNGVPEKICFDSIKNDLILGEVQAYGIGYIIAGVV